MIPSVIFVIWHKHNLWSDIISQPFCYKKKIIPPFRGVTRGYPSEKNIKRKLLELESHFLQQKPCHTPLYIRKNTYPTFRRTPPPSDIPGWEMSHINIRVITAQHICIIFVESESHIKKKQKKIIGKTLILKPNFYFIKLYKTNFQIGLGF